jgi:carbonic anhydrase
VRNIANLIPPYEPDTERHGTSAALEYAVLTLKVEHIVVMGHAMCGGVRAYVEQHADGASPRLVPGNFIGLWISLLTPAAEKIGPRQESLEESIEAYAERLGRAAIIESLANLRTFPYVRENERAGALALHGAYFGVADGQLYALEESSGTFHPMGAAAHAAAIAKPRF